jgi:hypothetical protein
VPGLTVRVVPRRLLDLWLETDEVWWRDVFVLQGVAARGFEQHRLGMRDDAGPGTILLP